MTIGEKIRYCRKKNNLTQKQLGELTEIDEATIGKYENGKLNPKLETLDKISKALDIDTMYFFAMKLEMGGAQMKPATDFDELVTVKQFIELSGYEKTKAYEFFKNKQLARLGILVKTTPPGENGGWRINWRKFNKWASDNAKSALNV